MVIVILNNNLRSIINSLKYVIKHVKYEFKQEEYQKKSINLISIGIIAVITTISLYLWESGDDSSDYDLIINSILQNKDSSSFFEKNLQSELFFNHIMKNLNSAQQIEIIINILNKFLCEYPEPMDILLKNKSLNNYLTRKEFVSEIIRALIKSLPPVEQQKVILSLKEPIIIELAEKGKESLIISDGTYTVRDLPMKLSDSGNLKYLTIAIYMALDTSLLPSNQNSVKDFTQYIGAINLREVQRDMLTLDLEEDFHYSKEILEKLETYFKEKNNINKE
jgi:hypothetical protein